MNRRVCISGAGQSLSRWTPAEGVEAAPSPHSLAILAANRALGDVRRADVLAVVRTTEDSVPTSTYPNGRNANPPGTLARDLGIEANELIYSGSGGQTPQSLVNEMANRIHAGEIESALIVGAEAVGAAKAASRAGLTLDWADDDARDFEDRGLSLDWLDADELRHGLITPAHYYGLMENRLAFLRGESRRGHRRAMAGLFAPFAEVAKGNPFSQFGAPAEIDFLATPSPDNYPVTDPYLKWHMAQDAVNQGAAVLLSADDGIGSAENHIWLCGGADAVDATLSRREAIERSRAMDLAAEALWQATGQGWEDLRFTDLYSCFPVAVWAAAEAFGGLSGNPSETTGSRALTLTGGLPFFGGPGNNYSLHAIAEMYGSILGEPGSLGLVQANGGWMSKQSAGLYSGAPVDYVPVGERINAPAEVEICGEDCAGRLETFTFPYMRDGSAGTGAAFVRLADGRRAIATVSGEALARIAGDSSPIGEMVTVEVRNGIGALSFDA